MCKWKEIAYVCVRERQVAAIKFPLVTVTGEKAELSFTWIYVTCQQQQSWRSHLRFPLGRFSRLGQFIEVTDLIFLFIYILLFPEEHRGLCEHYCDSPRGVEQVLRAEQ